MRKGMREPRNGARVAHGGGLGWKLPGALTLAYLALLSAGCTGSGGSLPTFAYRSRESAEGYRYALSAEGRVMEKIPCYCGCGQSPLFRSLLDCFVGPEGVREHAASCQVCLDEARDVRALQARGAPLPEIRGRIEEKYGRVGPPTDTPPLEGPATTPGGVEGSPPPQGGGS